MSYLTHTCQLELFEKNNILARLDEPLPSLDPNACDHCVAKQKAQQQASEGRMRLGLVKLSCFQNVFTKGRSVRSSEILIC